MSFQWFIYQGKKNNHSHAMNQRGNQRCSMLSLFSTRKIIIYWISYQNWNTTSLFINLSAKMHEFPLHCISTQTCFITLAMEFTKPQMISKHLGFRIYIPGVRQQYEINPKPKWEMNYLTGFCSYCIEWGNLKCKILGKKWPHKPCNYYLVERRSKDDWYDL